MTGQASSLQTFTSPGESLSLLQHHVYHATFPVQHAPGCLCGLGGRKAQSGEVDYHKKHPRQQAAPSTHGCRSRARPICTSFTYKAEIVCQGCESGYRSQVGARIDRMRSLFSKNEETSKQKWANIKSFNTDATATSYSPATISGWI